MCVCVVYNVALINPRRCPVGEISHTHSLSLWWWSVAVQRRLRACVITRVYKRRFTVGHTSVHQFFSTSSGCDLRPSKWQGSRYAKQTDIQYTRNMLIDISEQYCRLRCDVIYVRGTYNNQYFD